MTKLEESWRLVRELKPVLGDEVIVSASVTADSELVLLAARPDAVKAATQRDAGGMFAASKVAQGFDARVLVMGEQGLREWSLESVPVAFPQVALLSPTEVLVAGTRCLRFSNGEHELNGCVFGADGRIVRRFLLGDGIENMGVSADGKVWVSYFDEGIFGNYGWNQGVGASGLVCFGSEGEKEWEFMPPAGFDMMCDCYAMNVNGASVWAYYYTEFPLVRVGRNFAVKGWKTPVRGARAFAVAGDRVAFYGGYKSEADRLVVCRFGTESVEEKSRGLLSPPEGVKGLKVIGQGSRLHLVSEEGWFEWRLDGFTI